MPTRSPTLLRRWYFLDRFAMVVLSLGTLILMAGNAFQSLPPIRTVAYCDPPGYFATPTNACLDDVLPADPATPIFDVVVDFAITYLTWPPIATALVVSFAVALSLEWYVGSERWRPQIATERWE